MLDMRKAAVALEPEQLMELERIVVDEDFAGALIFLKKRIYQPVLKSQQGRLKCHLDGSVDPVGDFEG
jgi:hypothetical protein